MKKRWLGFTSLYAWVSSSRKRKDACLMGSLLTRERKIINYLEGERISRPMTSHEVSDSRSYYEANDDVASCSKWSDDVPISYSSRWSRGKTGAKADLDLFELWLQNWNGCPTWLAERFNPRAYFYIKVYHPHASFILRVLDRLSRWVVFHVYALAWLDDCF